MGAFDKKALFLAGLLICTSGTTVAMTLTPKIDNGSLSVTIADIDYPVAKLSKALKSGLPNNIGLWLTVTLDDKEVHVTHVNYQITFDLWDELYQVQSVSTTGRQSDYTVNTKEQLLDQLSTITLNNITPSNALQTKGNYQLKAQLIVNPVQVERIKKIQAWIASSNGYDKPSTRLARQATTLLPTQQLTTTPDLGVSGSGVSSSGPRFQKLFDQILEQYMQSEKIPALWHSPSITIDIK